ncbi:protein YgfX [Craterilacuibacter sinensis]|uniref:protein YgfX n=1 Tax=Craterilacuibacter sinensis TaxID=2686017 RepID=UPI001C826BC9|nr:protein YgfX [Craterilacuibacter sinensis]
MALRRSRLALLLFCLLASSLALAVLYCNGPWGLLLLDAVLLLACLQSEGWLANRRRPLCLDVSASGVLSAVFPDSSELWQLDGNSRSSPWLCIVMAHAGSQRRRITLWPDSADADALRKLRVFLRWQPDARRP